MYEGMSMFHDHDAGSLRLGLGLIRHRHPSMEVGRITTVVTWAGALETGPSHVMFISRIAVSEDDCGLGLVVHGERR